MNKTNEGRVIMGIYLDYAASTPIDAEILSEVLTESETFGNPSSTHKFGKRAKSLLEASRTKIASYIGAAPQEIIITSGATEANNLAIKGVVNLHKRPHIITTNIEHASVKTTYESLEETCDVTYINVKENGIIDITELKEALREDTVLVSIILVNNETGMIQPVYEIAQLLEGTDTLLHLDAVQAFGHVDVNVDDLQADLVSLSAHKIYGPKGVGILYCRKQTKLAPLLTGGAHEAGKRAGTENNMWAHAMERAMEKGIALKTERNIKEMQLKELFINELIRKEIPFDVNGDVNNASPHIINVYFPWVDVQVMLMALDMRDVYISGGSACNSGSVKPSHVITAMYDEARANHSFRFSFSYLTSEEEIVKAVMAIEEVYQSVHTEVIE